MVALARRDAALSVLDLDSELGQDIPAAQYEHARRCAAAPVLELNGPRWEPSELPQAARCGLGLFVADGLVLRQVTVASQVSCELFGHGDTFWPWDDHWPHDPLAVTVDWLVLKPARVALLDQQFARRVARWPSIATGLVQRAADHADHLALATAITHLPRTHVRLLVVFWCLAQRWGTVTPDGVLIELPLTHALLASLVGNRRPTVTLTLGKLARQDLLIRHTSERWLLTHKAIEVLAQT